MPNNTLSTSLNHLTLLKLSGDDTAEFLQGQLTNDINQLHDNWHYSGYCNPKGRLLAMLQIWRAGESIYALIHSSIVEPIVKRLRMYVMRSKVTIEVLENAEIYGLNNIEALARVIPELAANLNTGNTTLAGFEAEKTQSFALTMSRTPLDSTALSEPKTALSEKQTALSEPKTALSEKQTALSETKNTVLNDTRVMLINLPENSSREPANNRPTSELTLSSEQWLSADIENGLAQVTEQSSELFIPQMLNLDAIGGISFKKGCYTGQEIVARMHYLGKLKQRMFVCDIMTTTGSTRDTFPEPGDKIFSDAELTRPIGHLVTAVRHYSRALAVLRLETRAALNTDSTESSKSTEMDHDDIESESSALWLESGEKIKPLSVQPYHLPDPKKSQTQKDQ